MIILFAIAVACFLALNAVDNAARIAADNAARIAADNARIAAENAARIAADNAARIAADDAARSATDSGSTGFNDTPSSTVENAVFSCVLTCLSWLGMVHFVRESRRASFAHAKDVKQSEAWHHYFHNDSAPSHFPEIALSGLVEMMEEFRTCIYENAINEAIQIEDTGKLFLASWRIKWFVDTRQENDFARYVREKKVFSSKEQQDQLLGLTGAFHFYERPQIDCEQPRQPLVPPNWKKWVSDNFSTCAQEMYFKNNFLVQYRRTNSYNEYTEEWIIHLLTCHFQGTQFGPYTEHQFPHRTKVKKYELLAVIFFVFTLACTLDILGVMPAIWSTLAELWDSAAMLEFLVTAFPRTAEGMATAAVICSTLIYLSVQTGKWSLYSAIVIYVALFVMARCRENRGQCEAVGATLASPLYSGITAVMGWLLNWI